MERQVYGVVAMNNPNIPTVNIETGELSNGRVISHGTASVLHKLYTLSSDIKRPTYELYLISIATIIRNIFSSFKGIQPKQMMQMIIAEIEMYNLYISQYSSDDVKKGLSIEVVYYYPSYKTVKPEYLRNLSKAEVEVQDMQKLLFKNFADSREVYGNVHTNMVIAGRKQLPHIEVNKYLNRLDPNMNYKKCCMVSHVPLDYHFSAYSPHFTLLRSHTADLVTRDRLGDILFKYKIPFNKYTHLVFGDSKYLKCILSVSQKKKVEEVSLRDKWKFKTEYQIMEYFLKSGLVPHTYFKNGPL